MREITLLMIFLILIMFTIPGCSSRPNFRDKQFQRRADMTEEERQQMFEEMQQRLLEACQDKSEGDSCKLENPMGKIEGICKTQDKNLVCTIDRPMRQRGE